MNFRAVFIGGNVIEVRRLGETLRASKKGENG